MLSLPRNISAQANSHDEAHVSGSSSGFDYSFAFRTLYPTDGKQITYEKKRGIQYYLGQTDANVVDLKVALNHELPKTEFKIEVNSSTYEAGLKNDVFLDVYSQETNIPKDTYIYVSADDNTIVGQ